MAAIGDSASRFTRQAVAAAAAVAGSKAQAATGVTAMRVELVVYAAFASLGGVAAVFSDMPGYTAKLILIAVGCILGAVGAALVTQDATPMQRAQRGFASLVIGFLAALAVLAWHPDLGAQNNREWLIPVSGGISLFMWAVMAWIQKRGIVDSALDALADKFGVKTNKRNPKPRMNDEHEDGV